MLGSGGAAARGIPLVVRRHARRLAWVYLIVAVGLIVWTVFLALSLPHAPLNPLLVKNWRAMATPNGHQASTQLAQTAKPVRLSRCPSAATRTPDHQSGRQRRERAGRCCTTSVVFDTYVPRGVQLRRR
jgi:hypothetical protein